MSEIILADLSSPEHGAAIVLLLDEYAKDLMGGGEELGNYTKQHLIDALRERPNAYVVLAYVDGEPAGLAICFEAFSTFACKPIMNIHDFAVVSKFRGQGLAKGMLDKVEAVAKEVGCCKITLEVLEGNHRAKAVYEQFGFASYELDPSFGRAMFFEKKLTVG